MSNNKSERWVVGPASLLTDRVAQITLEGRCRVTEKCYLTRERKNRNICSLNC